MKPSYQFSDQLVSLVCAVHFAIHWLTLHIVTIGPACRDAIPIGKLSAELHDFIPANLDIRSLCRLGVSSPGFRRESQLVIRARLERAFEEIDLDCEAVRFILTQSRSIISGWFIYHLAHMDFTRLQDVETVDFYVPNGSVGKLFSRFLKVATVYNKVRAVLGINIAVD